MKRLLFISLFLPCFCFGQNQGNIWYFGGDYFDQPAPGAGLDFNGGSPVALLNSSMGYTEGNAARCNSSGQLLFYTGGETVYDKTHNVMLNGDSIGGHFSTEQSCIIVPFSGDTNNYYIFTNDGVATSNGTGLKYSIIDMTLNGGLGAVTTKAVPLLSNTSEELSGTLHNNGHEFWIVTTEDNTGIFHAFKVNDCGVDSAVVSDVGFNTTMWYGKIKISPNSNKIAVRVIDKMYLLDFDDSTGVISNPLNIHTSTSANQGFCFSPDGNVFYEKAYTGAVPLSDSLFQYDLNAPNIAASRLAITSLTWPAWGFYNNFDMQIAPDGKIYMNQNCDSCLDVINNPNILGFGCNFQQAAIYLNGRFAGRLLPNSLLVPTVNEPCDTISSIQENLLNEAIMVYPNPTSGKFQIQSPKSQVESVEVYDLFGRLVLETQEIEIDMSNFSKGLYFVKAGEVVKKVILQ